jgi:hypothetical protein
MSGIPRNVVNRTWRHSLAPGLAALVHEQHRACALHGGVELCTISDGMEMPVGHEVFVPHSAGQQDCGTPKESAGGPIWNGSPEPDPVDLGLRVHRAPCCFVFKDASQLAESLDRLLDAIPG